MKALSSLDNQESEEVEPDVEGIKNEPGDENAVNGQESQELHTAWAPDAEPFVEKPGFARKIAEVTVALEKVCDDGAPETRVPFSSARLELALARFDMQARAYLHPGLPSDSSEWAFSFAGIPTSSQQTRAAENG